MFKKLHLTPPPPPPCAPLQIIIAQSLSAYSKYKSMRKIGQHSKPDNTKHMAAWDTVSKGICIRSTVKMANKRFSSVRHWLTHLGEGYNDLFSPHYLIFLTFAFADQSRAKTAAKSAGRLEFCFSHLICWFFVVFSFSVVVVVARAR